MGKDKNPKSLSWDAFQSMGNPENAPIEEEPTAENDASSEAKSVVRIYKEHKNRRGKIVSIIKGIEDTEANLEKLTKELKKSCGVGGAYKNGEILIQGSDREKIKKILISKGFTNTKLAGA